MLLRKNQYIARGKGAKTGDHGSHMWYMNQYLVVPRELMWPH